jgi:hypothetical protein
MYSDDLTIANNFGAMIAELFGENEVNLDGNTLRYSCLLYLKTGQPRSFDYNLISIDFDGYVVSPMPAVFSMLPMFAVLVVFALFRVHECTSLTGRLKSPSVYLIQYQFIKACSVCQAIML